MSGGDRFSFSSAPVRRVKSVQFGILDPDFIVRNLIKPSQLIFCQFIINIIQINEIDPTLTVSFFLFVCLCSDGTRWRK